MKVIKIYSNNFTSSNKTVRKKTVSNPVQNSVKDDFYSSINKFLKNDIDKKQYLKLFSENVNKIKNQKSSALFNEYEKKYIQDILMTMDLTDKLDKIPENYISENMKELLKAVKKSV